MYMYALFKSVAVSRSLFANCLTIEFLCAWMSILYHVIFAFCFPISYDINIYYMLICRSVIVSIPQERNLKHK